MKISLDDQEIFSLSETQKSVIKNDISEDIFDADIKRRLEWVLMHKYEQSFKRLKYEWEPKLAKSGVAMIPIDKDAFAQVVFAHPEYKAKKQRDLISEESAIHV